MLRRSFFLSIACLIPGVRLETHKVRPKTLLEVMSEAADREITVSVQVFDTPGQYRVWLAACASPQRSFRIASDCISDSVWQKNTPAQREALVALKAERLVKVVYDAVRDATDPTAFGYHFKDKDVV